MWLWFLTRTLQGIIEYQGVEEEFKGLIAQEFFLPFTSSILSLNFSIEFLPSYQPSCIWLTPVLGNSLPLMTPTSSLVSAFILWKMLHFGLTILLLIYFKGCFFKRKIIHCFGRAIHNIQYSFSVESRPFYSWLEVLAWISVLGHHNVIVQLLNCVQLFVTPSTAAHQYSLSFTISWSLFKLMSIESVMPSNHLILCLPLLLPSVFSSVRGFSKESVLFIKGQSTGASASAAAFPMIIQRWFPLGLTGLMSLLSKALLRVFCSTTVWKH